MNAKDILTNYQNFAVIGVTNNHNKFGYKIFQRLKQLNKTVFGISPIYKDIDGITMYSSLSEVNKKIDVAVFVVNPKFGIEYAKECQKLEINHIWLQPGTYDDNLISLIKYTNINYYPNCILVESQDI
ncbi:CoA-binding protein [Thomasclavelia cocleata]|uniref:CoA-binding domain-containing protein n=1 Tax=Thomasclavelia cocleata TaxID=69824 RepID=A0A829ZCS7_9FIRM|nr:CoA-binding protein [Thomasclavelia cocleata]GFI41889.1 hypothetical protein IMSAGC017_01934 [Thomasclavelia cocleata]